MLAIASAHSSLHPFDPNAHEDGLAQESVEATVATLLGPAPPEAPSVHTGGREETAAVTAPSPPVRRRPTRALAAVHMPLAATDDSGTSATMAATGFAGASDGTPPRPLARAERHRVTGFAPQRTYTDEWGPAGRALRRQEADRIVRDETEETNEDEDLDAEALEATAQAVPPVPPPKSGPSSAFHVSAGLAKALRVYDVFPSMPDAMRAAGIVAAIDIEICVSNHGDVSEVTMDREGPPALKDILRSAIRTWRYRPLVLGGNATPFCHEMQVRYSMN